MIVVCFFLFSALDFRGEVRVESRGEAVVLDPATMISSSEDGVVVSILFFFFTSLLQQLPSLFMGFLSLRHFEKSNKMQR